MRAEAVTGVVRIGHTDLEIAPKFLSAGDSGWQTVLWRILSVVEGGHVDENLTTAHDLASLSMPDLLAEMLLASYAKGAARGLPRGYLTEQASGNTLRGSLDPSRLGEWVARPWELPYVADLLTDDTSLARLLRWSAECLAATVKAPGRARAVREIAAGLSHVGRQLRTSWTRNGSPSASSTKASKRHESWAYFSSREQASTTQAGITHCQASCGTPT